MRHAKRAGPDVKVCTVCGVLTSRPGGRCTTHTRQSNRSRHNAVYSTRAWQHLSARVLRSWRGEHGNLCPGYRRGAHPAADLTVDHVVPLAAGGAPFDIANTAVLCRSCNSTKGASTDRGGVAHMNASTRPDRASRLCAHGRVSPVLGHFRQWGPA
jgi:5-methylcytosine-specific restriction protein A